MTPLGVVQRFRKDVDDTVEEYFWSDTEVLGYLNGAQDMLCRLVGGLRDASSEAAEVEVEPGEPFAVLHPTVLKIRGATLQSTGRPVDIVSYEDLSQDPCSTELTLSGPVRKAVIGMEEERLRLIRIPTAADTIRLVVERLPLQTLAVGELSKIPDRFEVREEHHLALLLWMKHLAYAKQDAETFDKAKSEDMKQQFADYCATAKAEKDVRNYKPRRVVYGGL